MIRGSHIVVRKLFDHEFAYIFQAPDGRIVFALPYEGDFTLIGTTESEYTGDLAHPAIAAAEQAYLLDMANRYFQRDLGVNDVVWTFAGLRPLLAASMDDPKSVTRDYVIDFDRSGPPLLSMYGGKLTTYRKLAEQVVDMLAPALGLASNAWTAAAPLPGGDMPDADFEGFLAQMRVRYDWLAAALLHRYARAYGTRMNRMLAGCSNVADLGRGSAARPAREGGSLPARCGIRPHGAGHPLSPQQARRAPGRGQRETPGRVARAALTRASARRPGGGLQAAVDGRALPPTAQQEVADPERDDQRAEFAGQSPEPRIDRLRRDAERHEPRDEDAREGLSRDETRGRRMPASLSPGPGPASARHAARTRRRRSAPSRRAADTRRSRTPEPESAQDRGRSRDRHPASTSPQGSAPESTPSMMVFIRVACGAGLVPAEL